MRRIWMLIALSGLTATLAAAQPPKPPEERIPPFVKTVELHPGLPPLEVRVIPAAPSEGSKAPLGRVEVSRRGEPGPFQMITVTGEGYPLQLTFSKFADANFDGYTDLLLGHEGGAKWIGYAIYFYDPESGTFVQNGLSREMSERLTGQDLIFHPKTREIELTQLPVGCQNGFISSDTFVIQGSHLRQIEEVKHVRTPEGCYAVKYRLREDGALAEVSRECVPDLDEDPD